MGTLVSTPHRSAEYAAVQERLSRGWNTWDTRSLLNHVHLPDGVMISLGIKEYYYGHFLRHVQIGRNGEMDEQVHLGAHDLAGSYSDATVTWRGIRVRVRSATDGDELVLLIETSRNQRRSGCLAIAAGLAWGMPGSVSGAEGVLRVETPVSSTQVYVSGLEEPDPYVDVDTPHVVMSLAQEIVVSTGRPRTAADARSLVEEAESRLETDDFSAIVRDCVAWNTLFEPQKQRVMTQTSRLWNVVKRGGYSIFCWDAFFGALLAGVNSPDLAYANALEMIAEAVPDGFVPNVAQGTGRKTYDGSQPPIGSMAVWELYKAFGEEWLLRDSYDGLAGWNRWWWSVRRQDDLICGGSTVFTPEIPSPQDIPRIGQHFGATCESGADDHPVFADIPFDTTTGLLAAYDIGLSSEYAMDCEYLALIAAQLGRHDDSREFAERAVVVKKAVDTRLWDPARGVYSYHFVQSGSPTAHLSPMSFFPMLAGIGSPERVDSMVKRFLRNPEWFGDEWAIPSSPYNDPRSERNSYWYGRVWPPINFLVYIGLLRGGRSEDAAWLDAASIRVVLKEWREHRHIHENYSSATGEGCDVPNSEPFLTWGGLLALIHLIQRGEVPYFSSWREGLQHG